MLQRAGEMGKQDKSYLGCNFPEYLARVHASYITFIRNSKHVMRCTRWPLPLLILPSQRTLMGALQESLGAVVERLLHREHETKAWTRNTVLGPGAS